MTTRRWTEKKVRDYCKRRNIPPPPESFARASVAPEEGQDGIYGIPSVNHGEAAFRHFWRALAKGTKPPVEQYAFRANRGWKVDFAFVEERLAVEINGAVHAIADKRARDYEKWNGLCEDDWAVLHFSPEAIEDRPDRVIATVLEVLEKRRCK